MQTGGRSKTIKFPKHKENEFGDVVLRVCCQPTSVNTVKVSTVLAPVDGDGLQNLGDHNSRKFPVIGLSEVRAKIFPPESLGQNLGLGFQPIFILTGAEPGSVDIDAVNFPTSWAAKEASVMLLQSSTKPNVRINATKWLEAIQKGEYVAEKTTLLWPPPRAENDANTSDSAASVDTDGEKCK